MSEFVSRVTVEAPINIAFIKYWGKRNGGEELVLPVADSFSITLSVRPFRSKTTIELVDEGDDELWLNGERTDVNSNRRLMNVLAAVRATAPREIAATKAKIYSENNFPTAAGMASSASGFCALAVGLINVYKSSANPSILCRIGSGSACRSVFGGFVKWLKGVCPDGSDCISEQFAPASHWPELQILCAVVKGKKKKVSSTKGMAMSVKNSPLMKDRIEVDVPQRMEIASAAVAARDFAKFAHVTMDDSEALQAVCRATTPPLIYYNQVSLDIMHIVRAYNRVKGEATLAYTFDAGPNAFLFTLKQNAPEVIALMMHYFPTPRSACYFYDQSLLDAAEAIRLPHHFTTLAPTPSYQPKRLSYLLQTRIGDGPVIVNEPVSKPQRKVSHL